MNTDNSILFGSLLDLTAAGRLFFHILGDQPPQHSGIGCDGFRLLPMFLFHLFRQAQQSPCIAHNLRQPLLSLLLIIPVNARFPFQAAAKIACQSLLLYPRLLVCAVYFQQPPRQLFDPFPQQVIGVLHGSLAQDGSGIQGQTNLATL